MLLLNNNMKFLSLKHLLLLSIIVFLTKGSLQNPAGHIENNSIRICKSQLIVIESAEKNCLDLEFNNNKSRPSSQGEKVEPIVINCSEIIQSKIRLISCLLPQNSALFEKNCLLSSFGYPFILQSFHKSKVISILRI